MRPVSIYFTEDSVSVGNELMDWEQAADLSRRLEVVVRYHQLYMIAIKELESDQG